MAEIVGVVAKRPVWLLIRHYWYLHFAICPVATEYFKEIELGHDNC
jgi:hypothetical protein